MVRAIVNALACLLPLVGSACVQKSESYLECTKYFPEAGMYRLGPKLLEKMVQKQSLPEVSGLPLEKDADADVAILIDQHGLVACAAGFSGEPTLVERGVKAAREWKFKPYVLAGRPIVIEGNIYFHYSKGKVVAGFVATRKASM